MKDQAALALGHGLPARPPHAGVEHTQRDFHSVHTQRDFHSVHDREIRYVSVEGAHLGPGEPPRRS